MKKKERTQKCESCSKSTFDERKSSMSEIEDSHYDVGPSSKSQPKEFVVLDFLLSVEKDNTGNSLKGYTENYLMTNGNWGLDLMEEFDKKLSYFRKKDGHESAPSGKSKKSNESEKCIIMGDYSGLSCGLTNTTTSSQNPNTSQEMNIDEYPKTEPETERSRKHKDVGTEYSKNRSVVRTSSFLKDGRKRTTTKIRLLQDENLCDFDMAKLNEYERKELQKYLASHSARNDSAKTI